MSNLMKTQERKKNKKEFVNAVHCKKRLAETFD